MLKDKLEVLTSIFITLEIFDENDGWHALF